MFVFVWRCLLWLGRLLRSEYTKLVCIGLAMGFHIASMLEMYCASKDWEEKKLTVDGNISVVVFNWMAKNPYWTMLIQTLIQLSYSISMTTLNYYYRTRWSNLFKSQLVATLNFTIPFLFPITSTMIGYKFTTSDYSTELFTHTTMSFIFFIYSMIFISIAGLVEAEYGAIDILVAVALGFAIHFTPSGREFGLIFAIVAPVGVKNMLITVMVINQQEGLTQTPIPTPLATPFWSPARSSVDIGHVARSTSFPTYEEGRRNYSSHYFDI